MPNELFYSIDYIFLMKLERKKIYDPLLRLIHFGLAFLCLILIISAYIANTFYEEGLIRKSFWIVHVFSGFGLSVLLVIRMLWGIIGAKHARFKELLRWKDWKKAIQNKSLKFDWDWGHHPRGAFAYIIFYLVILFLSISGLFLAAIEHDLGPLASLFFDQLLYKKDLLEIHEVLSYLVIIFIFVHIFSLARHELKDRIPIIQSMFSGFQYRKIQEKDIEKDIEKNKEPKDE